MATQELHPSPFREVLVSDQLQLLISLYKKEFGPDWKVMYEKTVRAEVK